MWKRVRRFLGEPAQHDPLIEFEDGLLLIVDAEQLATMGQFAAGIAHELRNPLTAIRSTIQFLSGEFDEGSENRDLARGILDEVDRLNNIVGNLLSLAHPSENRPVQIDLRQEIEKCVSFTEAKARSQNVKLQVICEEGLPSLLGIGRTTLYRKLKQYGIE